MLDLGWLDLCLKVESVARSRAFYEALDFRRVEGDDTDGWAVMVHGESRLGLFEPKFMDGRAFSLNFRGGDVFGAVERLKAAGYEIAKGPTETQNGDRSATILDPDGNVVFFDCANGETRKT